MTAPRAHPATRPRARAAFVAVVLLLGIGPALGADTVSQSAALPLQPGQVAATAVHPFATSGPRTTDEQVALVEVFTATWCPPCAPADRALDRLLDERSPALARGGNSNDTDNTSAIALAVLQYHPVPDPEGEDPFGVPEGVARLTRKHDAFWFPSVYVQGILEDAPETRSRAVDAGMEQVAYESYGNLIRRAAAMDHPLVMTTESRIEDGNITLDVRVVAERAVPETLFLQGALWQDHLFFPGSNGIDTHRMTVLALTERSIAVAGLDAGETWTASWTLPVPPGLDVAQAGMTVFVEAAWEESREDGSNTLMSFAAGSAVAAAAFVFWGRTRGRRRRGNTSSEGEA